MASLPGLRIGLALDSATFIRETRRVDQSVNRLQRNIEGSFASIGRVARGVAAGFAAIGVSIGAAAFSRLVRDSLQAADAMAKTADKVGVTVEQLQELRFAAARTGAEHRTMDMALQRFSRRLGEAAADTGELKGIVQQYNLQLRDADGNMRPLVEILRDYADIVSNARDPQEQLRLAFKAFDSEGAVLVNLLREGSAGIDQYADRARRLGIVTNEQARAAEQANDALEDLSQTISANLTGAVAMAAPQIEGLAFWLGEALKATRDFFEELNAVGLQKLNFEIGDLNQQLADLVGKRRELAAAAREAGLDPAQTFAVQQAEEEMAALRERRKALIEERNQLQFMQEAQEELEKATKPATAAIMEQADAIDTAADVTKELTAQQKRLAEAGRILTRTSAQEERYDAEQEALQKLNREMDEHAAAQQRLADERRRVQEREAAETERLLNAPFKNFLQNVQTSTANAFETIYSGGIQSFSDLFEEAKRLAVRFAAELTTLAIFNPRTVLGLAGATGAASPAAAGTGGVLGLGGFGNAINQFGGSLGFAVPAASGVGPPTAGFLGTTASLSTVLGAGALGGLGGGIFGSLLGGQGALGGSIGGFGGAAAGALIGSAFPGVGTVLGGLIGGVLGGGGGGLLGSLFGGGDDKIKGSFSGPLGAARTSGDSEVAAVVRRIDDAILALLDTRQRDMVRDLARAGSISVKGGLSSSDIEGITSRRLAPVVEALGFNRGSVLRGDAEAALQNFQEALGAQRAIRELTEGSFAIQIDDLATTFADITDKAKRFGVSIDGLAEAQERAQADLRRQQDQQLLAALSPFDALAAPLEAFQNQLEFAALGPVAQFTKAQEDFATLAEEAAAGGLDAIAQLAGAGQDLIALGRTVGASPGEQAAIDQVSSTIADVLDKIREAQAGAEAELGDDLERLRRDVVDTLSELRSAIIDELRRLTRTIAKTA